LTTLLQPEFPPAVILQYLQDTKYYEKI
jgi:hypothetical protein